MDNRDNENVKKEDSQEKGSDVKDCNQELQDWKEKYMRARADLDNFSKRVEKERIQWITIAHSEILNDLLAVVDNFDRALNPKEKKDLPKEVQIFLDGFTMISKSFYKFLDSYSVKEITDTKLFDPQLHEAIAQIESADHKSGDIVEVMQKGFMIKDKVLRPAKVIVAK